MPLAIKTPEELKAGVDSLEPQFATLLEEKGVSQHIRGLLGIVGLRKSVTLAGMSSNEELARTRLEKFLNVTEEDGIELMIQMSNLLEAWRASRARVTAHEEAQAEAAASGRLRDVPHVENMGMRGAHERIFGETADSEYPCRDWLGWRISQFETGHFSAEVLEQVVSYEQAGDDRQDPSMSLQFTPGSNKVTAVRKGTSAPLPKTTEELRRCYLLMKTHWEVIQLRYPDRALFNDYRSSVWDDLIRQLLGPEVYGYRSRKEYGIAWEDLLDYEFNIRKAAYKEVTKNNKPLHLALKDALACPRLQQKYFTLQLCTTGQKYNDNSNKTSSASSGGKGLDEDAKRKGVAEKENDATSHRTTRALPTQAVTSARKAKGTVKVRMPGQRSGRRKYWK